MRRPSIRPRHDQIAELTREIRLPLAPIAIEHLEIVAEYLQRAFHEIRADEPDTVATGSEPEITALLQARLNKLIHKDALWGQLVLWVARGTETISFDGSSLETRPDLSIILSTENRCFPLIAEAKILDSATSQKIELYCKDGIRRFVQGKYAWANCEAFMLAYVRDSSLISTTLNDILSDVAVSDPDAYLIEVMPVHVGSRTANLAYSRHGREFTYPTQAPPNKPGPIYLWHLWLM